MKTVFVSSFALAAAVMLAPAAEKTTQSKAKAPPKIAEQMKAAPNKGYPETMWDMATMPKKVGEKTTAPRTRAEKATVGVNLTDRSIQMPRSIGPGKTEFVVTNRGSEKQNFQISGGGVDKKLSLAPNQTKKMEMDLKSGSYQVLNPSEGHGARATSLKVK